MSSLSCETLESKQLLAADVAVEFSDRVLETTDPISVAIEGKFEDDTVSGTVVKFETNAPLTDNDFYVELTDNTPLTNANFLSYVNSGAYDNSMFHRSVSNFVIQGGGFTAPTVPADQPGSDPVSIPTTGTVQNEPGNLNTRGTIAMAKLGGQPDSATSQFFFNLENNSFLDSDNGGYTVFGEVLGSGMTVVDTMAGALTYDATSYYSNTALSDLPLWNVNNDNIVRPNDFVKIENADVVTESDLFTYEVSSSDAVKLTASFDGNGNLLLTPVGDASGSVDVTVTATSRLDNTTASDTFSVQLNGGGSSETFTTIESHGQVELRKNDQTTTLYADETEIIVTGQAVPEDRFPVTYLGAETLDGENIILYQNSEGDYRFWNFGNDWVWDSTTYAMPEAGSAELQAAENAFQVDIDDNGSVGKTFTTLESIGLLNLKQEQTDLSLHVGQSQLLVSGQPVTPDRFPVTYLGAESYDGVNTVLFKNVDNEYRYWQFDSEWKWQNTVYAMPASDSAELSELENAFEVDIDANNIIGQREFIDDSGELKLMKSTTDGSLYVGSTQILVSGVAVTPGRYSSNRYLGIEKFNDENVLLIRDSVSQNFKYWKLNDLGQHESTTQVMPDSGTAELLSLENTFDVDIDGDNAVGRREILDKIGSTRLMRNVDDTALYVGQTKVLVSGSDVTPGRYSSAGYVGAAVINGTNTILIRDKITQAFRYWQLDDQWQHQNTITTLPQSGTSEFFELEGEFDVDIDGNGVVGSRVLIETTGESRLSKDSSDSSYYAGSSQLIVSNRAVTPGRFRSARYVGVETVNNVNIVLIRDSITQAYRYWQMDSEWVWQSTVNTLPTTGSAELNALEGAFDVDIDGDNSVGTRNFVEQTGSVRLLRDSVDSSFYAGASQLIVANRVVTPGRFSSASYIGAETVDNKNIVLIRDTITQAFRYWQMDVQWNHQSTITTMPSSGTDELQSLEEAFDIDIDGNGSIGGRQFIEAGGVVNLMRDSSDQTLYAGANQILVSNRPVTPGRYSTASYLGADVVNNINIVLIQDTETLAYRYWQLDPQWKWQSTITALPQNGSPEIQAIEGAFNIDIDGDTFIGRRQIIEAVGTYSLQKDLGDQSFYAGATQLLVTNRPVKPGRFATNNYIGVEQVDNKNLVLIQDAQTGNYKIWQMNNRWQWQSTITQLPDSGTPELSALELAFGVDLDA